MQSEPRGHWWAEVGAVWPEADWRFYSTLRGQSEPKVSFRKSVQRFQSKKLTAELPEHPDDKLPQRLGKIRRNAKAFSNIHHLIVCNCLSAVCRACFSPVACSAPRSSWKRRLRVLESCPLKQSYWRTGTGSPWCSERRWTSPGLTPGSLLAVGCSDGPSLCAHSSYAHIRGDNLWLRTGISK